MPNPIVHVELTTNNPEKSTEFYSKLFGWNIDNSWPGYPMFQAEGGPGGGFIDTTGGEGGYQQGDVIVYLNVDNLDSKLQEVESAGGKTLVAKTEIPNMGWFAHIADPAGTKIGLFQGSGNQQG